MDQALKETLFIDIICNCHTTLQDEPDYFHFHDELLRLKDWDQKELKRHWP